MSKAETAVETVNPQESVLHPPAVEVADESFLSADEIPIWLNEGFIQNILQKFYRDDDLKVKCLRINQCGGKGDSYASMMFRVGSCFIDGKKKEHFRTYIVKTLPELDIALEKLGSSNYNVQNKEMEIYQRILPEFKKILESINEDADIFPAVLAVDKALDVIVLEDLAEKQFVMANRLTGLDMNHTSMALRKLARMHSASVMLQEKDPTVFAHLDTGFFTRKTDCFHVMFETLCDAFISEVSSWDGYEYYGRKLLKVRKNLIKNAQRAFDCDEGDFHVLLHGDLWTNNLMFRYDASGDPIDTILLDFQFASYGSPGLDLIYFLYTSTTDDLRQEKMEELIQYYYYELKDLLVRLGYERSRIPTLQEFQVQVLKKYFYVFTSGLLVFAVMINQDKDADFESLMNQDERALGFKKRIYQNPKYQAVAKKLLPMLDRKGILDDLRI